MCWADQLNIFIGHNLNEVSHLVQDQEVFEEQTGIKEKMQQNGIIILEPFRMVNNPKKKITKVHRKKSREGIPDGVISKFTAHKVLDLTPTGVSSRFIFSCVGLL